MRKIVSTIVASIALMLSGLVAAPAFADKPEPPPMTLELCEQQRTVAWEHANNLYNQIVLLRREHDEHVDAMNAQAAELRNEIAAADFRTYVVRDRLGYRLQQQRATIERLRAKLHRR